MEGGKRRRRKIADAKAKLSELHSIMEQFSDDDYNNLNWLAKKFKNSSQFKNVGSSQQTSYEYARGIVCRHPTLKANTLLGQIPLQDWKPRLVQKLIDAVGESNGPSAAKKVKEYLNRLFN